MGEGEPFSVQEGTREPLHRAHVVRHALVHAAVDRIADDGVADGAQVHADLVRAAGGDGHANQRHARQLAGPRDARDGLTRPARPCRDPLPMHRVASERQVDALAVVHRAPHERHVFLLDFAVVELARQLLVGGVVLGHHHDA